MTHKFNVNNKPEAHIERWSFVELPKPSLGYLIGQISNHPYQQSFRSTTQSTTEMVKFSTDNGYMETKNTFYILGSMYTPEQLLQDQDKFAAEVKYETEKYMEKHGHPPKDIFALVDDYVSRVKNG